MFAHLNPSVISCLMSQIAEHSLVTGVLLVYLLLAVWWAQYGHVLGVQQFTMQSMDKQHSLQNVCIINI